MWTDQALLKFLLIFANSENVIIQHLNFFSEEEISAMGKELEKYGIQMPAFSKIGGILASEVL